MLDIPKKLRSFYSPFGPLAFSLRFLSRKRGLILGVVAASFISTYARLLIPIFIGDSVTAIEGNSLSNLIHFAYLIILVSVISAVLQFVVNYGSLYTSQAYSYNLRKTMINRVIHKNTIFFENQTSGDLLSRLTMDIEATRNFVMVTLAQLIPTIFMIGISVYLLYTINPVFSLTFLLTVPVLIYIGIVFQRKQRGHWRSIRNHYGRMNEELQENIVGQRVVRGYLAENSEIGKFTGTTDDYFQEYNTVARMRGFYNNLMPLIVSGAASVILAVGGYLDFLSGASVGPLVAALNIFSQMSFPISFLGRMIVFSENASAGISRMSIILDDKDMENTEKTSGRLSDGDLEFRDVNFRRDKRELLRDINLKFRKGEFTGITGRTGSGKTTLINLISRFYEPTSGEITIGGKPISEIPLSVIRSDVASVYQEISLLSGSIRENISFGGKYSEDEITMAGDMACLTELVSSLPGGYETVIGERGITLSGGQRQRVAIARALVRKPSILILDDATSSVDPETELKIFRNVRKGMPGIITIIVSHRESALHYSDRIVILKDGVASEVEDGEEISDLIELRLPEEEGEGYARDL